MTEIRLHDTMAREKRVFKPADPSQVTMYVCGPTVYNRAHIGNARAALPGESSAAWFQGEGDARIDGLVAARSAAKKDRNFTEADQICAGLAAEGVLLEDSSTGTTWRRA